MIVAAVIESPVATVDGVEGVAVWEEAEVVIEEVAAVNLAEGDLAIVIAIAICPLQHPRKDAVEDRPKRPHGERIQVILIWDPRQRRRLPRGDDLMTMEVLNHHLEVVPGIGEDLRILPHRNAPRLSAPMQPLRQTPCLRLIHHQDRSQLRLQSSRKVSVLRRRHRKRDQHLLSCLKRES